MRLQGLFLDKKKDPNRFFKELHFTDVVMDLKNIIAFIIIAYTTPVHRKFTPCLFKVKNVKNCQNHSLIITRRTGNLHHFSKCLFEAKY